MLRAWIAAAVLGTLAGCAPTSGAVECDDDSVCAAGLRCVATPGDTPGFWCVAPGDLAACDGLAEGAACTSTGGPGACTGGLCTPPTCGNAVREAGELCDDGNTVARDGCSADCRSDELCGDGVIDTVIGEQCDDGAIGLSGDGCSSTCVAEYRLWRDVTPEQRGVRFHAGLAPDPREGSVLALGGTSSLSSPGAGPAAFGDLWRWEGGSWSRVDLPVLPPARAWPAMATDAARERLVVFGGADGGDELGDTWEFDGVAWAPRTPAIAPPPRAAAALACAPGRCVLFGGWRDNAPLGDTWLWDGTTWSQLALAASPSPRHQAALAYDAAAGRMVLFGGNLNGDGPSSLTDTWELDLATLGATTATWTQLSLASPLTSDGPFAVYVPTRGVRLVITRPDSRSGELWTLDRAPLGWNRLPDGPDGSATGAGLDRARLRVVIPTEDRSTVFELNADDDLTPRMVFDLARYRSADLATGHDPLRGGTAVLSPAGTLAWRGGTLRRLPGDGPNPGANAGVAVAFDLRCRQLVAFGGAPPSAPVSDATWRLTIAGWLPVTQGARPPRRARASIIFDEERQRLRLFGGDDGATAVAPELWELDNTNCANPEWIRVPTATAPPARTRAGFAYDARRRVAVLVGGQKLGPGMADPVSDVWELAGSTWTNVTPPTSTPSPAGLYGLGAAYDPLFERVIVVGGTSRLAAQRDTWSWDGATWTRLALVVEPPPLGTAQLARDDAGLLAIASTGLDAARLYRLTSEQVTSPRERCEDVADDDDRDGLRGCADPDCWTRCTPACRPVPGATPGMPAAADPTCLAATPRCGDGTCSLVEDERICPADC